MYCMAYNAVWNMEHKIMGGEKQYLVKNGMKTIKNIQQLQGCSKINVRGGGWSQAESLFKLGEGECQYNSSWGQGSLTYFNWGDGGSG